MNRLSALAVGGLLAGSLLWSQAAIAADIAQDRGELRADADVQTLRDVLYGVIEYRLFHSMPIEHSHIDAVLDIAFCGVR